MKISAIILTKNEEQNILDCLNSVKWCDEVIVIDDSSFDKTKDLIKKFNHKNIVVYQAPNIEDFSQKRNYGLSKAKEDWVLFIDADERITESLAWEISNLTFELQNKYRGFYVKRRDFIWGKELKHGEAGNVKLLRFAKRNTGQWEGKVHEKWKIDGDTGTLKNKMLHYPHKNIEEFLKEINFYTDIRSQELFEKRKKVSLLSIIFYPLGKFALNYFIKQGFRDNLRGLIFVILMSFHSFLVRGKLWYLWDKKKNI